MSSNSLLLERIVPAILAQTQQEAKVILQETRPHKQSYFRAKVERWAWEQTHHLFLYSLWPKNGFYVLKLLRKLKRRIFCDMWKSYGIHPSVSTNRVLLGHSHAHSLLSLVAASAPLLVVTKIRWAAQPKISTVWPFVQKAGDPFNRGKKNEEFQDSGGSVPSGQHFVAEATEDAILEGPTACSTMSCHLWIYLNFCMCLNHLWS